MTEIWLLNLNGCCRELVPRDPTEPAQKNDPEPVKRLKREMEVALSEEDFTTAGQVSFHIVPNYLDIQTTYSLPVSAYSSPSAVFPLDFKNAHSC